MIEKEKCFFYLLANLNNFTKKKCFQDIYIHFKLEFLELITFYLNWSIIKGEL